MSGDGNDGVGPSTSSSSINSRSRRNRNPPNKTGREDALDRLRNLRSDGSKNKYEVRQVENVYEMVDELTYSKKVRDRQEDDWIVDDGTGAYIEDGREVFDDDLIDHDDDGKRRNKSFNKKDKVARKAEREKERADFRDVREMFTSIPAKRKLNELSNSGPVLTGDEVINDLLNEIHKDKKPKKSKDLSFHKGIIISSQNETSNKVLDITSSRQGDAKPVPKKRPFVPFSFTTGKNDASSLVDEQPSFTNNDTDGILTLDSSNLEPIKPSSSLIESNNLGKQNIIINDDKANLKKTNSYELFGQISDGITVDTLETLELIEDNDSDGGKSINFYWLDIFEEGNNAGILYLFGKVQKNPTIFTSACVIIQNLTRCVYLLLRERKKSCDDIVERVDVYNEFNEIIAPKFKINEFKSRPVRKRYCFDKTDVPIIGDYIEIRYSGSLPALPCDLEGDTFSHIFGTGTPIMENFLLEKKLKGPCWLKIHNPQNIQTTQHQSWCKNEFRCNVGDVKLNDENGHMKCPPLVLASLNILSTTDALSKKDTIVFVGVVVHKAYELQAHLNPNQLFHDYFSMINLPIGKVWPLDVDEVFQLNTKCFKAESERAMLAMLMAKLQQIDADIYIGHDLNIDLFLLRLLNLKVPHWSRLGRLKRNNPIGRNSKTLDYKCVLGGRLICDMKISSMELIRCRSYDFHNLVLQVLGKETETMTGQEIKELFDSTQGLNLLINWAMKHCTFNIGLLNELQVMPLALQITNIAGNTLFRTLLGGRSERNEYLLLHAFHSKGFIVPDKYGQKKKVLDKKETYAGGMVLEPKKGFYDNFIILMDFNSLYPSIIQEYNICFTTRTTSNTEEKGILAEEIRKLVETRKQVKQLMKGCTNLDKTRIYDIRQKALKLTANSMYGCLGFHNSRFYAKELAAMITGYGREILVRTKENVERMGYEVIYGDTDSLMINSNTKDIQKVYSIGNTIKTEINKMYKLLELDIDGIFQYLLLLKKKKYAALLWTQKQNGEIETSLELKGLDMVRRDWAPIASNTAKLILNEIMTEHEVDEKMFKITEILKDISKELKDGKIELKDLIITKQLAKNPEEYKDSHGLYHVQVARRMNEIGNLSKKFRNGDTVPYIFCTDGLPHHITELNSRIMESNPEIKLEIDVIYYLGQQIHPVVSRICEPIQGLHPATIAQSLGIDSSKYRKRQSIDEVEDKTLGDEYERFIDCETFKFKCPFGECENEIKMDSCFTGRGNDITFTLMYCNSCGNFLANHMNHILNLLTIFLRKFINKYYENRYICEDPICENIETVVGFDVNNGYPLCRRCKTGLMCKEYRDFHLYKQLTYLYSVFDLDKQIGALNQTEREIIQGSKIGQNKETENLNKVMSVYEILKNRVNAFLNRSGYSEIKLCYLFQGLYPQKLLISN